MASSRKKSTSQETRVVAPEILERAKHALETDTIRRPVKCSVCGSDATGNASDALCWVCRRLKISAWRDADIQMNMQE